ncbi:MAG TPA: DUF4249 family protein [Flavobacterium sp.]|nr:DUF4249 family protein [Flavobacterium sp.]
MKNLKYIFFCLLFASMSSCEEVVDVDLNTAAPRLVIDASIVWQKGTAGNLQKVKLTTTAGYYETSVPNVSGATVFITNSSNTIFNFTENPGTGEYICTNFVPVLNSTYVLTVIYNGETYTATETLKPVPVIDSIEQRNDGGFTGEDIEIKTLFTDNGATTDFYLFRYKPSFAAIPAYYVLDDEFVQGNQVTDIYSHEDLASGQTFELSLYGISQTYYNYMLILTGIAGESGGGPFSTPSATLRGNIVNTTNFDNYALGYFNVSEMDFRSYTVQ